MRSSNLTQENYYSGISIIPLKQNHYSSLNELLKTEVEEIVRFVSDKRSIPALINLLDDEDFDVRWIAGESLIRIGRESIPPLLNLIRTGRKFSYPGKVYYVLRHILPGNEREALQPLLLRMIHGNSYRLTEKLKSGKQIYKTKLFNPQKI